MAARIAKSWTNDKDETYTVFQPREFIVHSYSVRSKIYDIILVQEIGEPDKFHESIVQRNFADLWEKMPTRFDKGEDVVYIVCNDTDEKRCEKIEAWQHNPDVYCVLF